MSSSALNAPPVGEARTFAKGYVFGAPIKDLGWFASLIMGVATGMMGFFLATFFAIVFILFWNAAGHHHADFAASYRLVGLPVGIAAGVMALSYLATFWVKRIARRA